MAKIVCFKDINDLETCGKLVMTEEGELCCGFGLIIITLGLRQGMGGALLSVVIGIRRSQMTGFLRLRIKRREWKCLISC